MRNKYNAIKTRCASGHVHDSKGEAARCDVLHTMQRMAIISGLTQQPEILLAGSVKYRADFLYMEDGKEIWEDYKGVVTERMRVVMKLWPLHGSGTLRITSARRPTKEIKHTGTIPSHSQEKTT